MKRLFCFKYICKLARRAAKDASDTRQEQKIIGAEQRNAFIEACGTAFFEDFSDKLRAEIISSAAVLYSEAAGDAAEQAVSEKRMAFHHAPYSHTRSLCGSLRDLKTNKPAKRFPMRTEKAAVGALRGEPAREREALAEP